MIWTDLFDFIIIKKSLVCICDTTFQVKAGFNTTEKETGSGFPPYLSNIKNS